MTNNNAVELAMTAYKNAGLSFFPTTPEKNPVWKLLPQGRNKDGAPLFREPMKDDNGNLILDENGKTRWVDTTTPTNFIKRSWSPYRYERPTDGEIERWMSSGVSGIAMVCGKISGNVEVLDFDTHNGINWFTEWVDLIGGIDVLKELGIPHQLTGSGTGHQIAWRCDTIEGSQKIAKMVDSSVDAGWVCMIETKGEGGYALLPPSAHKSGGTYRLLSGKFSQIPTITLEQRELFLDCARILTQVPEAPKKEPKESTYSEDDGDYNEVMAAFNRKHRIETMLSLYGYTHAGGDRWSRPGKRDSAGVVVMSDGKAYAHSINDRMSSERCGANESRPFSSFDLFAYYDHNEDYKAATKAAAVELGITRKSALHTLVFVEGERNRKVVADLMFQHGWVARGIKGNSVSANDIDEYTNVIVWAKEPWKTNGVIKAIGRGYPIVARQGYDAVSLYEGGVLQAYLDAVLADAKNVGVK